MRKHGIKAVIPVKEDQKQPPGPWQCGLPSARLRPERYKGRNTAGRFSGKFKQFRAVATRYDWSIPGFMHTWFCVTQLRQVALL